MKNDQKIIISTVLGTVLLFIGILWLTSSSQTPIEVSVNDLVTDTPHAIGADSSAAVMTIVEFSDFDCPACALTYPTVKDFVDSNSDKVRLVYRHFPLVSIHPNAQLAAVASEVAAESGLFWQYHDLLFKNQALWSDSTKAEDLFADYAEELGMDRSFFIDQLSNEQLIANVFEDTAKARELRLNATPTFFINGELVQGAMTQDLLERYLQMVQK